MTIDRIKISSDNNGNTWIGAECIPDPGESPDEAYSALRAWIKGKHEGISGYQAPAGELPVIQKNAMLTMEHDAEFLALKTKLDEFDTRESALAFLQGTNWKFSIEAKDYINNTKK